MVSIQYVFMLQHVCFQPTTRLRKGGKEGTAGLNVPSIVMLLYVPARVGDNANVLKKKKASRRVGVYLHRLYGERDPENNAGDQVEYAGEDEGG